MIPPEGSSGSGSTTGPGMMTPPGTSLDTTAGTPTQGETGSTGSATTSGSSSSSGSSFTTGTTGLGMTDSGSTSDGSGSSSGGSSSDSGSTSDGSSSEGSSSSGGMGFVCPPGGGLSCNLPAECPSNACYTHGFLGGVCSECDEDADCAFGCSPSNPFNGTCATCCDGSLGCGCETDLACQGGLLCTQILDVAGIVDVSTCSECTTDLDCAGGDLCAPAYDLSAFAGQHVCVAPMSLPDGEGCNLNGSGDLQCVSGNCAPATLMGIPVAGICSVCNEDADCPIGSCVFPEIIVGAMVTINPGVCV